MVYLRLGLEQAAALRGLAFAAGLHDVVAQLDAQRLEGLLPSPMPALALWRGDAGPEEIFPVELADAMYQAMQQAWASRPKNQND